MHFSIRILLPLALIGTALAETNWPQFRGPGAMGSVEKTTIPDTWSQTENVAWKVHREGDRPRIRAHVAWRRA